MARDYGRIRSQFWPDEKVKAWPLDVKAVAAYLMTCEHATALGAYRLPAAYMSDDLDISPSQTRNYLDQLERFGWIKVCKKTGWVWIINYLRHNRPENVNVWKHVRGLAKAIPDNVIFRDELLASIERPTSEEPKETVQEAEITPLDTQKEGIETVSNNKTEPLSSEPLSTDPNLKAEGAKAAPPPPAGSRLPPDWQPTAEHFDFAAAEGFSSDAAARIAEDFRDYWIAVAGSKGRKADWMATWRKWVRTDAEKLKNGGKQHHSNAGARAGRPAIGDAFMAGALAAVQDREGG